MLTYVVFGGMLATTWVQIIKAVLLMTAHGRAVALRARAGRLEPDRAVQQGARRVAREGRLPGARACSSTSPIDTVSLGLGAGARHRRPAAHPDAVLHRARRQGRALERGVGDGADRRLLHHDHVPGLRRPGDPGHRGRGGRRHGRQPGRAAARRGARRRRRHGRRRPVPGDHRRGRVRDDPRGRGGPRDLGLGRGGARRVVEHHPQGQGVRARGGLRRADRRGRPSARSRSRSRSSAARA